MLTQHGDKYRFFAKATLRTVDCADLIVLDSALPPENLNSEDEKSAQSSNITVETTFRIMSSEGSTDARPQPYEVRERVSFAVFDSESWNSHGLAQKCFAEAPETFEIVCDASEQLYGLSHSQATLDPMAFEVGNGVMSNINLCKVLKKDHSAIENPSSVQISVQEEYKQNKKPRRNLSMGSEGLVEWEMMEGFGAYFSDTITFVGKYFGSYFIT